MATNEIIPRHQAGLEKTEPQAKVWPIYLVADESGSMFDHISEVTLGMQELLDAFTKTPKTAQRVWFSVIGFDYEIRPHLGLSDMRYLSEMPTLSSRNGATAYDLVFRYLPDQIDADITDLRNRNYAVIRPAVFFLTDGAPDPENQPWREALADLKSPSFGRRPNILSFGIGNAVPAIIEEVASDPNYAFVQRARGNVGQAIKDFFDALTRSVETADQVMGSAGGRLPVVQPKGFVPARDYIELTVVD